MRKTVFTLGVCRLLLAAHPVFSQQQAHGAWLHRYKEEFLTDARSPLRAADTGFLRFFPYHPHAVVQARLHPANAPAVVLMATHTGKTKRFLAVGRVAFTYGRKGAAACQLTLYQSVDSVGTVRRPGEFFLPFTDATNGTATYGGGRYLDLHLSEETLRSRRITIDFNQAYNPWCAYKEGYNCPIPPATNRLPVAVRAGERIFGGETAAH